MNQVDRIRVHLIFPDKEANDDNKGSILRFSPGEKDDVDDEIASDDVNDEIASRTTKLKSKFRALFRLDGQFSEYIGSLEKEKFLSTVILEDRPDNREDIREIYRFTKEIFTNANVRMAEQHSSPGKTGNREQALRYDSDVIIRVCNTDLNAPTTTQRVELNGLKFQDVYCRNNNKKYLIGADEANIAVFDLNDGTESWRRNMGKKSFSTGYSFNQGIIQITGDGANTPFLLSWQDGTVEWEAKEAATLDEENIEAWEPVKNNEAIYYAENRGTIYRINVADGIIENIINLNSIIRNIIFDSGSLYVMSDKETIYIVDITQSTVEKIASLEGNACESIFKDGSLYVLSATEQSENQGEITNSSRAGLTHSGESYKFSLVSLSNQGLNWEIKFEQVYDIISELYSTSKTILVEIGNNLSAYDRQQGEERWSLNKKEPELVLPQPVSSSRVSSGSYSKLKVLDVIDDSVYCVGQVGASIDHGFLVCINGVTGSVEWVNQDYRTAPHNLAGIYRHGKNIVFNHTENKLVTSFVALDPASGNEVWKLQAPNRTDVYKSVGSQSVVVTDEECVVLGDSN